MLSIYEVIKKPLVTEKSTTESELLGKYHFVVDTRASKVDVLKAVEALFGVQVQSVNTMIYRGKPKRVGTTFSKRKNYKKAIVTLKPGSEIDFFEKEEEE